MSKVYVANNMTHNYDKAEQFGELINLTEGKAPIFKTGEMTALLKDKLKDFTEHDYILVSGPAIISIMIAGILFKRFTNIKFLIFDAKEQTYVVRHLDSDNM